MTLQQIKNFIVGVLKGWFANKSILDKFSESEAEDLMYGSKTIVDRDYFSSRFSLRCPYKTLTKDDFTITQDGTTVKALYNPGAWSFQHKIIMLSLAIYYDNEDGTRGTYGGGSVLLYAGDYFGSVLSTQGTNSVSNSHVKGIVSHSSIGIEISNVSKTITGHSLKCKILA